MALSMCCWQEAKLTVPERQRDWHDSCTGWKPESNLPGAARVPCTCPAHEEDEREDE